MPNIFISYRRDDSAASARELYAHLKKAFSEDEVFFDIRKVARGDNFVDLVKKQVCASQVLLAVIGPKWADIKNKQGVWRLGQPDDLVRVEITTALKRNIRVIPVQVDGAQMPAASALPPELSALSTLDAHEITHTRVDYDVGQLILALGGAAPAPAAADPADDFWGTLASSFASKLGERLANVGSRQPPQHPPSALPFGPAAPPTRSIEPPVTSNLNGQWRATRTGALHLMQQRGSEILDQTLNPFGMVVGEARGRLVGNQIFLAYVAPGPAQGGVRGELHALVSPDGRLIQGSGFDSMMGAFSVELQRV